MSAKNDANHNFLNPITLRGTPKHDQPLRLKVISLDSTLELLINSKVNQVRDSRGKKFIRRYTQANLSQRVLVDLLQRAVKKLYEVDKILWLMNLLGLQGINELNFLGDFRYTFGYVCDHIHPNVLNLDLGTMKRFTLSAKQCQMLHTILLGRTADVRTIAISTDALALETSNLPSSIISRGGRMLRDVTILHGATNHILRLLGLNCPLLQYLDISHSAQVTDNGLKSLFLRFPRRKNSEDKNPCAQSLKCLTLLGTDITDSGHEFAAKSLGFGYSLFYVPYICMIYRPNLDRLNIQGLKFDTPDFPLWELHLSDVATMGVNQIVRRFIDRSPENKDAQLVLDVYGTEDNTKDEICIAVRSPPSCNIECLIRIEGKVITELVLPMDSVEWRISSISDLTDLATELPNLKILKARVQGVWNRTGSLLPSLEDAKIWTLYDSTILSFLQHCPAIKIFHANCYNVSSGPMPTDKNPRACRAWELDDLTIGLALIPNESIRNTLEDLCLRPAPLLTASTVRYLIQNCPNLKRLGDIQSWDMKPQEVQIINGTLDEIDSKCLLMALEFPPLEMSKSPI